MPRHAAPTYRTLAVFAPPVVAVRQRTYYDRRCHVFLAVKVDSLSTPALDQSGVQKKKRSKKYRPWAHDVDGDIGDFQIGPNLVLLPGDSDLLT
jgi:hypothetical protein